MALQTATFRSRTRGKKPVAFTYQGVGTPKPRRVLDSKNDNNPLIVDKDGNPVSYKYEKNEETKKYSVSGHEGITLDEKGNLVLAEGLSFVEVDDADVSSLAPKPTKNEKGEDVPVAAEIAMAFGKDVLLLFKGDAIAMAVAAAEKYNEIQRDLAAEPFRTVQEKEDELKEIVEVLQKHNVMSKEDETKWRRGVSMGFDAMGGVEGGIFANKLAFAYSTPMGKKAKELASKAA